MIFDQFKALYTELYEDMFDTSPFNLQIRRAYRRLGHLSPDELIAQVRGGAL